MNPVNFSDHEHALRRHMPPMLEKLTPREHEVLLLLASGLTYRAIAVRLVISQHTVKTHANTILGKLGAQSAQHAIAIAFKRHLITVAEVLALLDE